MATVVVLQHLLYRNAKPQYMVHAFAALWRERGHRVVEHFGTDSPPAGDVAILHLDLTVVPDEYRALCSRYPRVVNCGIPDASRERYSQLLVNRASPWTGPVIVKTNANYGGRPEAFLQFLAGKAGATVEQPPAMTGYPTFASLAAVPPGVWEKPGLIVEQFIPERHAKGFFLRNWLFLGNREVCYGGHSARPQMKLRDMLDPHPIPVPEEIRQWRSRLECDFGSFDFARHGDTYVLFDVNRSPGLGPASRERLKGHMRSLSEGLEDFL